ncbi:MAG TPA: hypothetical protein VHX38_03095 [Pseudonocardiaceae bacterium]|jgi:probable HAF family extracellular repeat protein/YD repeat-containing protein|nr:hypothetical protein [Pseudonocardiaceae bacterium]
MRLQRRSVALLGLAAITTTLVALPAAPAAAAQWPDFAEAFGINVSNTVVGEALTAGGTEHAVRWSPSGQITDLGTLPGGQFSGASGINGWGEIVGSSDTGANANDAVRWSPTGQITVLPGLSVGPGSYSLANAVNDAGVVVGFGIIADGDQHAVRWSPSGQITDLGGLPGYGDSIASAVNESGVAVGYSEDGSAESAVRWDAHGRITELARPAGDTTTFADGINDFGEIVGAAFHQSDGQWQAVEWDPAGNVHQLATGVQTVEARAVNDLGVIVGEGQTPAVTADAAVWYPDGRSAVLPSLSSQSGGNPDFVSPNAINDRGVAVGRELQLNLSLAVRWSPDGRASALPTLLNPAG